VHWLDRLVLAGVFGVTVALILGEGGRWHWTLELLSHFRVQYALAFAIATLYYLVRRRWLVLGASAALLAFAAWPVAPYLQWATAVANTGTPPASLRVMSLNLYAGNARADLVLDAIKTADPDILLLIENHGAWWRALSEVRAKFPYLLADGNPANSDLLLFSRLPLEDARFVQLGSRAWPVAAARVCMETPIPAGGCIQVVGVHPSAPITGWHAALRDSVLGDLPALLAAQGPTPSLVMGDFNCTPWSPRFRDLLAATGLADAARGFAASPTWFSRLLPFGLKIDHILIGGGLSVSAYSVGTDVGSDHYAVTADLSL